jgi:hypothetical protein
VDGTVLNPCGSDVYDISIKADIDSLIGEGLHKTTKPKSR